MSDEDKAECKMSLYLCVFVRYAHSLKPSITQTPKSLCTQRQAISEKCQCVFTTLSIYLCVNETNCKFITKNQHIQCHTNLHYHQPITYATKSRGRLNPPRLFMYCLQIKTHRTTGNYTQISILIFITLAFHFQNCTMICHAQVNALTTACTYTYHFSYMNKY